ncbi:MAG: ABC transporter substrate-binding protein [Patescibacteria group bacterium]
MVRKSSLKLLLGVGLIAILAGCASVYEDGQKSDTGTSTTPTAGEPIVIGALLPLSGSEVALGLPMQRVLQVAAKKINDAGGINGRMIKLEFDDGACASDAANKAINNLVSIKKVKVVIGGACSSETLAAAPVVEANKVVLLSPAASSPKITTAGDFIFRNYPSDSAQGQILAEYANKKGFKKVGMIVEEQPYTEGIADAFSAAFEKLGGKVVTEKYAQNASDFRTQITKLQAASVDMFFVDTQAPDKAGIVVKQLVEAGVKAPYLLNDVAIGAMDEVVKTGNVEGSVGAEVPYDKTYPDLAKLQESYKALSDGKEMPYMSYMAPTYDSLFIIKEAIEKVGEDPVKIKDYLYTVKGRKGLAGTLSFDSNGDPTSDYRHELKMVKDKAVVEYKE